MPATYLRPGVYLQESLLASPSDVTGTYTVSAFVGAAPKGPVNTPVRIETWSDYITMFGGFDLITPPAASAIDTAVLSYLPFAVYSFFQSGGRVAWIIRSVSGTDDGDMASVDVSGKKLAADSATVPAFTIQAVSAGAWANSIKYTITSQDTVNTNTTVFTLQVFQTNSNGVDEAVERFRNLTVTGNLSGTRRLDSAINDPVTGSRLIRITDVDSTVGFFSTTNSAVPLAGGLDPDLPDPANLKDSVKELGPIEGPINVNIVGYLKDAGAAEGEDAATSWVSAAFDPVTVFTEREDVFCINDSAPPKKPSQTAGQYATALQSSELATVSASSSYVASYAPWVIVPHPAQTGNITVPPGGGVAGVMARIDATVGPFRAPAGTIAPLSNAVGVDCKFSDTDLGTLNAKNINIIRPVVGNGMCIMGARTRKTYGPDRYVSARRVLISIKESLRRSTQWAVFENNDERLWSALRITAENILRPLWEQGGLRGSSPSQAYKIRCDASLNTLAVIASGEVRMEIGVALEYPAEFVIIKITQMTNTTFAVEAANS